jgi:hypothetical protein
MFFGRRFMSRPAVDNYNAPDSAEFLGTVAPGSQAEPLQDTSEGANLVVSATGDPARDPHMPVIDLDVLCNLIPATQIGHTHLYINHPVSQEGLFEILDVLAKHGIVEQGYVKASKARGYSAVRLPWVKKHSSVL